jgi:plasmid stabilization system protein ParE
MKLDWSLRAIRDLDELLAHVAGQDANTAAKMALRIDNTVNAISERPRIGTRIRRSNGYRFPIKRYGVTVFYRYRPRRELVEIVSIIRGIRVKTLD